MKLDDFFVEWNDPEPQSRYFMACSLTVLLTVIHCFFNVLIVPRSYELYLNPQ